MISASEIQTPIGYHHPEYKKTCNGCHVHYPYYQVRDELATLETNEDDVIVCGFPKSGSIVMVATMGMILHNADPGFLNDGQTIEQKIPFLEFTTPALEKGYRGFDAFKRITSGRLAFTHLTFDLLPESVKTKSKIIYHSRNPKDGLISLYYHHLSKPMSQYHDTLGDLVDDYTNDKVSYGPYFDYLASFWKHRDQENIMFTSYEEIVNNKKTTTKKLTGFLGKELTETQIDVIADETSFEKMKNNSQVNRIDRHQSGIFNFDVAPFMRSGRPASWKDMLSSEMVERMDAWIKINLDREDLSGWDLISSYYY